MKPHRLIPPLGLIAVFILSACAPASASSPAVDVFSTTPTLPAPTQTLVNVEPTQIVQPEATAVPTEVPPQAVATSRGPNLEATDPTTVKLASGQLQLVEFFRFT